MITDYIRENEGRFFEELFSLIRIPSISAKPEHHEDMLRCAERWRELLLSSGADSAEIMSTKGNPIVFAQKTLDPAYPTVLVYAHYDVMPAEPLELWKSEPFEPEIRDGRIWARGADDDKGQAMIQAKAFEYMVRTGALRCNVKFLFEGEEGELFAVGLFLALAFYREWHNCLLCVFSRSFYGRGKMYASAFMIRFPARSLFYALALEKFDPIVLS